MTTISDAQARERAAQAELSAARDALRAAQDQHMAVHGAAAGKAEAARRYPPKADGDADGISNAAPQAGSAAAVGRAEAARRLGSR